MAYEPTVWEKGDKISIARLNKLEEAVKEASDKSDEIDALKRKVDALQGVVENSSGNSDEIQPLKETVETAQKETAKQSKAKG
ncbi:hypothetical protein [Carnobacterium inhibens]|uniref:hypothetical protein n=1 Tax=Carnobacterium inhibens TaxID=147709 RepID=UPI000554070F|nr:hypothetical protein [Carnobacterium inhibens]